MRKGYYITLQLNPDERCLSSRDASFQMQFGSRCGWVYYHYNEIKTKAITECYICEILFINTLKIQVNTRGMQINLWINKCFTLSQYFIQLEYRFTLYALVYKRLYKFISYCELRYQEYKLSICYDWYT